MKRRGSRRLRANERRFVQEISPLDYTDIGIPKGAVVRVALIDTEAPTPDKPYRYFVEQTRLKHVSKTGALLKRPRKIVTPGASPGTVAFIDYQAWRQAGDAGVYIQYMATRDDMRGKGFGRLLLDHFMETAAAQGVTYINFGKIMNQSMWHLFEKWHEAHRDGRYAPIVTGKRFF
jgi:GNAT superfamily N-acetyltransferase